MKKFLRILAVAVLGVLLLAVPVMAQTSADVVGTFDPSTQTFARWSVDDSTSVTETITVTMPGYTVSSGIATSYLNEEDPFLGIWGSDLLEVSNITPPAGGPAFGQIYLFSGDMAYQQGWPDEGTTPFINMTFDVTNGQTSYSLYAQMWSPAADPQGFDSDYLTISSNPIPNPTPEPATMLLLGLGLVGLAGVRRKFKQ